MSNAVGLILNCRFQILDFGFWIADFGFDEQDSTTILKETVAA